MAGKTADGLNLKRVIKSLDTIPGLYLREGTNHNLIAKMDGYRPCPIAKSTHVKRMVVPWIKEITGYNNAREIYRSLRSGAPVLQY
ncbi:hypothetical protein CL616_02615 [archaeon]|nr:hypothetical protein [archaeon]|tara:strand:+ start:1599 stop:1856 length:258 start_codon:yes stop_codon:yes gene_type:complete